jgi:hypothetical protein
MVSRENRRIGKRGEREKPGLHRKAAGDEGTYGGFDGRGGLCSGIWILEG